MSQSNLPPIPHPNLTAGQSRLFPVLVFLSEYVDENHFPPSYRQIADYFPNPSTRRPASTNTVERWIRLMSDELDWITIRRGMQRSISITSTGMRVLAEYKKG